jgi:hypothetical protein
MAKKKTRSSKKAVSSYTNVKAFVSLFIVLLALGVLLLFNTYQDNIMQSALFKWFMTLVIVLFALLAGLLFLVNPHKK